MASVIHQPHDKFFHLTMSDPQVAREFMQVHLPKELLQKMDLSTLALESASFVDDQYRATEADLIFNVQMHGETAYIYLLCEGQSDVEPLMAFRLLVYCVRFMEQQQRERPNDPLPFVYPMIVYSGDRIWTAALEIFPLFGEHESLARKYLLSPYQLIDIKRMSDDEIKSHDWCGLMEFAFKHRKVTDFKAFLETLFPWLQRRTLESNSGSFLGRTILTYILDDMDSHDIKLFLQQASQHLSTQLRGEAMTLGQAFELRGEKRGRKIGMQEGQVAVLTRQLNHRFGVISPFYLKRIEQASLETVLIWSERLLDATSIQEVFVD